MSGFLKLLVVCTVAAIGASCVADGMGSAPESHGWTEPQPLASEPQFQRWLDGHDVPFAVPQPGKAILVNIPAFELIAFEDGEPVLRSRVIVGTPRTRTPILETYVSAVRFRPTWRPTPDMIASGEYADGIRPAGTNNPLGLAAVRLEPGLLVYLHDANRRELFDEVDRALSHGCIRVQRWDELVAWLLDRDLETVHAWAEGRRTFDVPASPVPVILGYHTAFPDDTGALQRFVDIYGREAVESSGARQPPGP